MINFSLTPSHIIEYMFCPRFTYFEYVLAIPQNEEKNYKVVKGRQIHDAKLEQNKEYLRKKIGVVKKLQNQYLTNSYLRGEVDEVLFLNNNTLAPLDYKFASYKNVVYLTYKTQLICYALLIEDNFKLKVNKGFLVYVRSSNKLIEEAITEKDKSEIKNIVENIFMLVQNNVFPNATKFKARCSTCTYTNICIK